MKPIYLSFAGLNSYQEEQHIDFTYLFGAGVFGIFGPTGSGKSTILDALTLALYGSVERATHRTQGILNQYSKQVSVAFTFDLEDAVARRRFRVERTFKQGKVPGSVEGRQARLLEVNSDEAEPGQESVLHVLAENGTNVTATVEELLGLKLADFTRAVVLPQGKFADFLTLQGAERRNMLQRLFGLELYGDRLMKQLRTDQLENENQLELTKAAKAEIGDASAEVVEQTKQQVAQALQLRNAVVTELATLEQEHAQWAQVWSLQTEMAGVVQQLAALEADAPQVSSQAQSLALAQRAEMVRPAFIARQTAVQEVDAARSVIETAQQQLEASGSHLTAAQTERSQAEAQWAQESPVLYSRQANLTRAVELEKQLVLLQTEQQEAQQALQVARQTLAMVQVETEQAAADAHKAGEELEQVRQQILARTVDPEQRAQVTEAAAVLKRLQEAEQQQQTELQECAEAEAAVHTATEEEQAARAAAGQAQEALASLQEKRTEHTRAQPWEEDELTFRRKSWQDDERIAYQIKMHLPKVEQAGVEFQKQTLQLEQLATAQIQAQQKQEELQAQQVKARAALTTAENALQQVQQANMAATLAKQVTHGSPCPVCGAKEHPHLATSVQEELQAFAQAVTACRERLLTVEAALTASVGCCSQTQARHEVASSQIAAAQSDKEQAEAQLAALWQQLPQAWQHLQPAQLPQVVAQAQKDLTEHEQALKTWQQLEKALEKEEKELTVVATKAEKQLATCEAALASFQRSRAQAQKRVQKAQQQVENLQLELDQARGSLTLADIAQLAEQYRRWDKEVVSLRKKEAQWALKESTAKQSWEAGRAQVQQQTLAIAVQEGQEQALQQRTAALQADIVAVTGGQISAVAALAVVSKQLVQYEKARTDAQKLEKQAEDDHQRALQASTSAQERLRGAHQRLDTADKHLAAALQEQNFASADDMQTALLSKAEQEALQTKITEHRDALKQWQQEERRLHKELAGRTLNEAEWAEKQAQLAATRVRRDAALQAHAVAEKSYQDLLERHERWTQLAQQENELNTRQAHLDDLTSLLRGNALVDFLAEQQLQQVAWDASAFLGRLTGYRYAVEVGSDGSFIIRDDANGGYRRAVHTLSGGETFLTSLALALALSSQIQLQGKYPLEFFFLDEGFGSLDQEVLDVAMTALERLHLNRLHVGIISHVPELRNRILRRLIIEAAVPGEHGSRIVTAAS